MSRTASRPTPGARWHWILWLLPAIVAAHALAFWGRGIVDVEARSFIVNYLADRPWLDVIFDPELNDWGAYQARELSYAADYVDAQVLAALHARGILLFVPVSGALGLVAIVAAWTVGAGRVWRLDRRTAALTLTWFLSTIVVQASTGIFYRSAKVLLSVLMLVTMLLIWSLLSGGRATWPRWIALALLCASLPLADRQGLFVLALGLSCVLFWLATMPGEERVRRAIWLPVTSIMAAGIAWAALYGEVIAPRLIWRLNGYWPDFSYQQLDLGGLARLDLWYAALAMLGRQLAFLAGGLSAWLPAALLGVVLWRTLPRGASPGVTRKRALVVTAGLVVLIASGLVVLFALMILRHRQVYTIPDHAYWYYFLPVQVVFFCAASILISRAGVVGSARWRTAVWIALGVLTVLNVSQYPAQRAIMSESRWLRAQLADTAAITSGYERLRTDPDDPDVSRWVSAGRGGGVLRLPLPRTPFFPDSLDVALAARARRRPFDQAWGPHWPAIRNLLARIPSSLDDPREMAPLVEAWRQMGIREVIVNPGSYEDPAAGTAVVDAVRATGAQVIGERRVGPGVTFALADAPAPFRETRRVRPLPLEAVSLSASQGEDELRFTTDGNLDTRWSTGGPQRGGEWMRLTFDRPRDIARLRLELTRDTPGDYPRVLRIDGRGPSGAIVLYEGRGLPLLVRGVLRHPLRTAVEVDFPPSMIDTVLISQTGTTDVWFWSVHELSIWER